MSVAFGLEVDVQSRTGLVARTRWATLRVRVDDPVVPLAVRQGRVLGFLRVAGSTVREPVRPPPLAVRSLGDATASARFLLGRDDFDVGSTGVELERFDPRLIDRERGRLADHLEIDSVVGPVDAPDTDFVGNAVQVRPRDVALGREDDLVDDREADVGPKL